MRWVLLLALSGCLPRGTAEPCPTQLCPPPVEEASCSPDESAFVFRQRIEPLLQDDRPQSCGQCHLQGIDLKAFVRETPCQSMACLVDKGMVDLEAPTQSAILGFIDRARGGPTPAAAEAEYQGFLAWIEHSAQCHAEACGVIENPCGEVDASALDAGVADAVVAPSIDLDAGPLGRADAGPPALVREADAWVPRGDACDPAALELRFQVEVMRWRSRCHHCHADDGLTAGINGAPLWMNDGPDLRDARHTLRRVVASGLLDRDHPDQSLLVVKPLATHLGGIGHGGGAKFTRLDDPGYLDFLEFSRGWAACQPSEVDAGPRDAGPSPDAAPHMGLPSEAPPDVVALCDCLLATCHTPYHRLFGEDEITARLACLRMNARITPEARACRARVCSASPAIDDAASCGMGLGEAECR